MPVAVPQVKARRKRKGNGIEAGIPKGIRLPVCGNRKKAAASLQRLQLRIGNVRADWLRKINPGLCRENQAVGIEDLTVAGMVKNDRLGRSISDIGMGELERQMTYKAKLYETTLIQADRWFPSSKMCCACGFVHEGLKLSDKVWRCPDCGTVHDRDGNASLNLKRLATAPALPVAKAAAAPHTFDEVSSSYGGKVTPVRYAIRPQEGSGQEEKAAVSIISDNHICLPF